MKHLLLGSALLSLSAFSWSGFVIEYENTPASHLHDPVDVSKYVPSTASTWGTCHHLDGIWLNEQLGNTGYQIETQSNGVTELRKVNYPTDPAITYISEILPQSIICKDNLVNVASRNDVYRLSFRLGSVAINVDDDFPVALVTTNGVEQKLQWSFGYQWVKGNE